MEFRFETATAKWYIQDIEVFLSKHCTKAYIKKFIKIIEQARLGDAINLMDILTTTQNIHTKQEYDRLKYAKECLSNANHLYYNQET